MKKLLLIAFTLALFASGLSSVCAFTREAKAVAARPPRTPFGIIETDEQSDYMLKYPFAEQITEDTLAFYSYAKRNKLGREVYAEWVNGLPADLNVPDIVVTYGDAIPADLEILISTVDGGKVVRNTIFTYSVEGKNYGDDVLAFSDALAPYVHAVGNYSYSYDLGRLAVPIMVNKRMVSPELDAVKSEYSGERANLSVSFSGVSGDKLTANFCDAETGNADAVNAGEYKLKICSLEGDNSSFYCIDEEKTTTYTINKKCVPLTISRSSFPYLGDANFSVSADIPVEYEIACTVYNENGEAKLNEVGSYTVRAVLNSQNYCGEELFTVYVYPTAEFINAEIDVITAPFGEKTYKSIKYIESFLPTLPEEEASKVNLDKLNGIKTEYLSRLESLDALIQPLTETLSNMLGGKSDCYKFNAFIGVRPIGFWGGRTYD